MTPPEVMQIQVKYWVFTQLLTISSRFPKVGLDGLWTRNMEGSLYDVTVFSGRCSSEATACPDNLWAPSGPLGCKNLAAGVGAGGSRQFFSGDRDEKPFLQVHSRGWPHLSWIQCVFEGNRTGRVWLLEVAPRLWQTSKEVHLCILYIFTTNTSCFWNF